MANTTFVDRATSITASWLNDVNDFVYNLTAVNAKLMGAVGNGTTDDTAALQAAMDLAATTTKVLYIPAGTYKTTKGIIHRQGVRVGGAGKDNTIISNQAPSPNFATGTTWHFGTYGPGNSSQGTPKQETGYQFAAAVLGDDGVTLTTPGQAANFSVGDLVSIEGSTLNASTLNTPNEAAIITQINVGTGKITFDAALRSDYPTGAATLQIRKLNTGKPAPISLVNMISGTTAYALQQAELAHLTLTATGAGFSALNLSCFNSIIHDVKCVGYNAIAGNPVARTIFYNIEGLFTNGAFEPAYLSHDTYMYSSRFARTAPAPSPTNCVGIWVNNGEGAKYITFEDVEISDDDPNATSTHPTVEINGERNNFIRGSVYNTRQCDSIQCGTGSLVDKVTIWKTGAGGNGIVPGGTEGTITNNRVYNTPVGKNAISVPTVAVGNYISGNMLGRGTRVAADSVNDVATSKTNVKSDNRTFYTKNRSFTIFPNAFTGTVVETIRATLSYTAGSVAEGHYFDIFMSGVCSGAGGAKTIRLKVDAVTAVTLTLPATGVFDLRGRIGCAQGAQTWNYDVVANVGGTVTPFSGNINSTFSTSTSVSITEQLANAGDTITTYFVEIRGVTDQATLS